MNYNAKMWVNWPQELHSTHRFNIKYYSTWSNQGLWGWHGIDYDAACEYFEEVECLRYMNN